MVFSQHIYRVLSSSVKDLKKEAILETITIDTTNHNNELETTIIHIWLKIYHNVVIETGWYQKGPQVGKVGTWWNIQKKNGRLHTLKYNLESHQADKCYDR